MEVIVENHTRRIIAQHPDLTWEEADALARHYYSLAKIVCADFRLCSSNHLSLENPNQSETITSQETNK